MKKAIKRIAFVICLLMLSTVVRAEGKIEAGIVDGMYRMRWSGISGEGGTLTVYVDGWPASVCRVKGPKGEMSIPAVDHKATYSARLTTSDGCLTADVIAPTRPAAPPQTTATAPAATPVPASVSRPAATPAPTAMPLAGVSRSNLAGEVVRQVNVERRKAGLKELSVSAELSRAAAVRAHEIVQKFSHTRPDGTRWTTVSSAAYGENIAMGQRTADKVMAAWMSSAGHRANILRSGFGSIGVCAWVSGGVTYWVQLFGK